MIEAINACNVQGPARSAQRNRATILKLVRLHGSISRSDLSRMTGLTVPAIMKIANGLLRKGILQHGEKAPSSKGKLSRTLALSDRYLHSAGIALGPEVTRIVICNFAGGILAQETKLDEDLIRETCWASISSTGEFDTESLIEYQEWAFAQGLLDAIVPVEGFWDSSFVNHANRALGPVD